jgi:predicted nuclease of predicted toxin-antitoxin system
LTFALDFGEIVAASEGHVVRVVLFRLHNTRTGHVIERLQAVLEQSSGELHSGAIIVVEEGRHRVRRLPIGS